MAKVKRCWGIDIGQCALKAMRCTLEGDRIVVDAFDFIEYPKILSQPEAEPEVLVREALETFLSRNEISRRDDRVAISVPGQSGLAKFFKPPPIDSKKIPDIVKFEAKQQIPFPLEEVIWDYQKLAGGAEVDGFVIDAEVGLFAMKRDQVYRQLRPFEKAEIELDIVQLAPMAIYNFVSHDLLTDGPSEDMFDPDNPPESIVVLSLGTDATDLVITNGFRMWQRSIPLGGNHFTKQLTKEMKLTFAKAEHLKRNARQAEDPKSVFQAMRPIFNDLVTEVQRSVGYFQGIDRKAKIKGVVLLGNTVKLPGLQQYIAKNLGYEVMDFTSFNRLSGPTVLSSPQFTENVLAFPVCYGLCLQGLKQSRLSTNLLPREILTRRLIKAKKPWAVASLGALMLACSFNFFFHYNVWSKVKEDYAVDGKDWKTVEGRVAQVQTKSNGYQQTQKDKEAQLAFIKGIGNEVVGAGDRRLLWLELMKTVNSALPWPEGFDPNVYVDYKTLPLDERPQFYIDYVESEYFPDLATWYTVLVSQRYSQLKQHLEANREGGAPAADVTVAGEVAAADSVALAAPTTDAASGEAGGDAPVAGGPTGPGWVIELSGYHYFNKVRRTSGANHVRNNFLKKLEEGSIVLPINSAGDTETFTMKEMGISFPILATDSGEPQTVRVPNPDVQPAGGMPGEGGMYGGMGGMYGSEGMMGGAYGGSGSGFGGPGAYGAQYGAQGKSAASTDKKGKSDPKGKDQSDKESEGETPVEDLGPPTFEVKKYTFTIQFCWQEKSLNQRLKDLLAKRQAEAEAAKLAAEAAAAETAQDTDTEAADGGAAGAQAAPAADAQPVSEETTTVPGGANNSGQ